MTWIHSAGLCGSLLGLLLTKFIGTFPLVDRFFELIGSFFVHGTSKRGYEFNDEITFELNELNRYNIMKGIRTKKKKKVMNS